MSIKDGVMTATNKYIRDSRLHVLGEIDEEALEKDLDVEKKGVESGKDAALRKNEEDFGLDNEERHIIKQIETLRDVGYNTYQRQTTHYKSDAELLKQKKNPDYFKNQLETLSETAISTFNSSKQTNKVRLNSISKNVEAAQREFNIFREKNDLEDREPEILTSGDKFLHKSIISFVIIIETILNGALFGGSLLDSIILASIPAFLNFVCGMLIFIFFKQSHLPGKKTGSFFLMSVFILSAILLNLGLAHFRGALAVASSNQEEMALLQEKQLSNGSLDEIDTERFLVLKSQKGADQIVLDEMLSERIFDLGGFQAWLLFVLGLICAAASGWEFYQLDDPYPGYGKVALKLKKQQDEYEEERMSFEEEKSTILEETLSKMDDMFDSYRDNLQNEINPLINKNYLYVQDIKRFEDELENIGNNLLQIYRRKYAEVAEGFVPKHFGQSWSMERFVQENFEQYFEDILSSIQREYDPSKMSSIFNEVKSEFSNKYNKLYAEE